MGLEIPRLADPDRRRPRQSYSPAKRRSSSPLPYSRTASLQALLNLEPPGVLPLTQLRLRLFDSTTQKALPQMKRPTNRYRTSRR